MVSETDHNNDLNTHVHNLTTEVSLVDVNLMTGTDWKLKIHILQTSFKGRHKKEGQNWPQKALNFNHPVDTLCEHAYLRQGITYWCLYKASQTS